MKLKSLSIFLVFSFVSIVILMSYFVSADLRVDKTDKGSVIISELDNPAVFDFNITNGGSAGTFEIYTLIGITMTPKGSFGLVSGLNPPIEVRAYVPKEIRKRTGAYEFEYQIKGGSIGIFKDSLDIKVVSLQDVLQISPDKFLPSDSNVSLRISNLENTNLENIKIRFRSSFFDSERTISLGPYESVNLSLALDKDKMKKLNAGNYVMTADISFQSATVSVDGVLNYLEKEGVSVQKDSSGVIVRKTTITKTNEGNVPVKAKIEMSKDIISRLFTSYSIEPLTASRGWFSVDYSWEKDLSPSESLKVVATTNYTFPFIVIILIVVIVFLAKTYSQTAVVVDKRVSFVRTKGGEFALKVRVHVKAKKHVDNVQVVDRLPGVMKLYEKFGKSPTRVDSSTRRLFWDIGSLTSGEERVFSYVIYTTIKVVGRFELPAATAVFELDGKTHEVLSNRTFFVSETAERLED